MCIMEVETEAMTQKVKRRKKVMDSRESVANLNDG